VITTSARLLSMLTLLQQRVSWSGDEMAERLGVTTRTVRRDADRLRELGYPVQAVSGPGGGYRLGRGKALPPLLLDDDEAVAAVVSLRTAAGGTVAGIGELSLSALAKLEQVLPVRLRARVDDLSASTVALGTGVIPVDADLLVAAARACRVPERISFDYVRRDGTLRRRRVEPYRLVHTGRRWYLVARDADRSAGDQPSDHGGWRTFRVDRMSDLLATGHRFRVVDPPDAAAFVTEAVSRAPYRYRARFRIDASAEAVRDLVPPTVATIEPIAGGGCELSTGADSLESIAVHVAALGFNFAVVEPPEMVDLVQALGKRLIRAADTG